jgi:hypothetical protein
MYYSDEELIRKYKEETGDLLIKETDKFQAFVGKIFDERLRKSDDVRFEGNPTILTDVLQMHSAIQPDRVHRLFHFSPTGLEITSISEKQTHMLKTTIPDKSYEIYNLGDNIEMDGGWIGLNIKNIMDFCKLGAKEDSFRYRYDSALGDFHVKFGGLRRKFGSKHAESFPRLNMPEMELRGDGVIKLKKFRSKIGLASKLGMVNVAMHLDCDQLHLLSHRTFESEKMEVIDDLNELIPVENWNGADVISNYSIPLLSGILDLLGKRFDEARILFSDDSPMKICCGKILGEEKDDLFCAEITVAGRTKED